jgi:hypothetical protein
MGFLRYSRIPSAPVLTGWSAVPIGAGGWITNGDIAADGTHVCRNDTYGAYKWNAATSQWDQLLTTASMPAGEATWENGEGVFAIAIASVLTSVMYMSQRGLVFKTVNGGTTWTKTGFVQVGTGDPGNGSRVGVGPNDGSSKTRGPHLAIDPGDRNKVFFGTGNDGLWVTTNGGTSWTAVSTSSIPLPSTAGGLYPGYAICFDPTSVVGGNAQIIYVHSSGNGTYRSTNAGSTWAKMTGGPTTYYHMFVDAGGKAHIVDNGDATYWTCISASAWTKSTTLTAGFAPHSVAVDPANTNHIVLGDDGGVLNQSFDGGATWTGPYFNEDLLAPGGPQPGYPPGSGRRVAADIPWLAWTHEGYMSNGNMMFGPGGVLYFYQGIGVWKTVPPSSYVAFNWTSQNKGIEQLVANGIVSVPGSYPVFYGWDRPIFVGTGDGSYPSTHGISQTDGVAHCWDIAYQPDAPQNMVANVNYYGVFYSGYSSNGGVTWTKFSTQPPNVVANGTIGGCIAMKSYNYVLYVPGLGGMPAYTANGGLSWADISVPGTVQGGWSTFTAFIHRKTCCFDGTYFYLYYADSSKPGGTVGLSAIYRSTDMITWTNNGPGIGYDSYNMRMDCVPGKTGHLLYVDGGVGSPGQPSPNASSKLNYSTNGGATSIQMTGVGEPFTFGFGKIAAGSDYPSVGFIGFLSGVFGIYVTTATQAQWAANTVTWTQISDGYPLGNYDYHNSICGDANTEGRWYIGNQGSGWMRFN